MGLSRAWLAACAAAIHAGCAGPPPAAPEATPPEARTAAKPTAARAPGLTLERLFVPEDPKSRRDGLAKAVADGLLSRIDCGLSEAGFTAYRLRSDEETGALVELLGGSPQRHETLHRKASAPGPPAHATHHSAARHCAD